MRRLKRTSSKQAHSSIKLFKRSQENAAPVLETMKAKSNAIEVEVLKAKVDTIEGQLRELEARMADMEYFRDNAKILLDISDVQDS